MGEEKKETSYVPPEKAMPELSLRYLILGIILALLFAATNAYLGLYSGMTISASIPAAIIAIAVFRAMRTRNILGNNIVQTIACAGEALAAGAIFTLPALIIINIYMNLPFWTTTALVAIAGTLGAALTTIIRKPYIKEEKLPFPEGKAGAEVLIVGDKGGASTKPLLTGGIIGGIFKFLEGIGLWPGTVEAATKLGSSLFYFGSDLSTALAAIGYIVGINVAVLIFLGGILGWIILIPILATHTALTGSALDMAYSIWSSQIRYIGVGTMLLGGLWTIFRLRGAIARGIKSGISAARKRSSEGIERTERELPLNVAFILVAIFDMVLMGVFYYITRALGLSILLGILTLILSFLGVSIAGYLTGLVGSSNLPVSGITIMNLLIAALILRLLGIGGVEGSLGTLLVAAMICMGSAVAGDMMQTLFIGYVVGGTPWKQQVGMIVGSFASAFIIAPILNLLINAYGIAGTPTAKGSMALAAPQATLMSKLTEAIFTGTLNWTMLFIGFAIAIVLIITDEILARKKSKFRTPVMPVAIGIYLPFSLSVPIFVGGLVNWLVGKKIKRASDESTDAGTIGAAGLIAGESIIGIVFAALIVSGISITSPVSSGILGIIVLLLVLAWVYRVGVKNTSNSKN
ncbi:oligopeptide transporter, OPT family [Fervidicoccus fontis]|uniref:Oligopeptide transporter, OPT family n=2 Tax=Fervidicoccus fontis TaxID=683846 RepID=I0A1P1_FERFK|nr:oligopeptide transporter, OPT family [Fervidicoccus fontis]AFH42898.1 oligopeptide transporter, OPT family [Fervidicoccus fontis Kam940]MBE9391545.1 oligopeptide transporter, OPT family [Fervidicoccus fontis]